MNSQKTKTYLNPELFPPKYPPADPPPQQQLSLYEIQQQVGSLRELYPSNELEYKALDLAYESLRMVWLAVEGIIPMCQKQVEVLDRHNQTVAEHLLSRIEEPDPEPVPVTLPDWLEA